MAKKTKILAPRRGGAKTSGKPADIVQLVEEADQLFEHNFGFLSDVPDLVAEIHGLRDDLAQKEEVLRDMVAPLLRMRDELAKDPLAKLDALKLPAPKKQAAKKPAAKKQTTKGTKGTKQKQSAAKNGTARRRKKAAAKAAAKQEVAEGAEGAESGGKPTRGIEVANNGAPAKSTSEDQTLRALDEAVPPATAQSVADRLGMSKDAARSRLDRLVNAGRVVKRDGLYQRKPFDQAALDTTAKELEDLGLLSRQPSGDDIDGALDLSDDEDEPLYVKHLREAEAAAIAGAAGGTATAKRNRALPNPNRSKPLFKKAK